MNQDFAFSTLGHQFVEHTFGDPLPAITFGAIGFPKLSAHGTFGMPTEIGSASELQKAICLVAHRDEIIAIGGARFGTAFGIGGGWILTAHHVLEDVECLRNHRAYFLQPGGGNQAMAFSTNSERYSASRDGIMADDGFTYEFDYAVAKLAGSVPTLPALKVSSMTPVVGDTLDILRPVRNVNSFVNPVSGFGIVRSVPAALGTGPFDLIEEIHDRLVFHNCSSYGGDSGAPLINAQGEVVGVHTHGFVTTLPDGDPKRRLNWGTLIRSIASDLKANVPDIHSQCTSLHAIVPPDAAA